MAAAQDTPDQKAGAKNENEDTTITIRLNDFIQKYRKGFWIGGIAALVILAAFITGFAVNEKIRENAFSKLDDFNGRYEALRIFMGSEEPDAAEKQADIDTLLAELDTFARSNSGYAAARAFSLSASVYEAKKQWAEAETLWTAAAEAAKKTYLAPVAVFNAAVAAEEQGNTEAAIGLYTRALDHADTFPGAVRAQFSIARLEEARNNKEAALEAYRNLLSRWPDDAVWSNLAQSRIVVLSD